MDLTQLEMFNAVASTGSITRAAQKVHRVPSNLTTRIRQLEADLGVELFIRENQRLRLSPAGHSFCAIASRSSPRWTRREWWWRATNPGAVFSWFAGEHRGGTDPQHSGPL